MRRTSPYKVYMYEQSCITAAAGWLIHWIKERRVSERQTILTMTMIYGFLMVRRSLGLRLLAWLKLGHE